MSLTIKFDEAAYRHALNQFVGKLNADAQTLLKEEMRLVLRDIVRFTPPKTLAQGRKAVAGDVTRAISPLDQTSFGRAKEETRTRMRAMIAKRDNVGLQAAINAMGGRRWIVKAFSPSDHTSKRNRYGRVRRSQFTLTTDESKLKRYLASVQRRVGLAKAGWNAAASAVGLRLPSWVRKHGAMLGSYTPPTNGPSTEIVATNRSTKIPNYYERHVWPAVRSRVRSIQSELRRLVAGGKSRRASLAGTTTGESS